MSKDCTCPGGGADPNRQQVWEAYRARKQQALEKGKGADTSPKGKGKGGGKGKKGDSKGKKGDGKGTDQSATAKAPPASTPSTPRATVHFQDAEKAQGKAVFIKEEVSRAAGVKIITKFPRDSIMLDTGANVHMTL